MKDLYRFAKARKSNELTDKVKLIKNEKDFLNFINSENDIAELI